MNCHRDRILATTAKCILICLISSLSSQLATAATFPSSGGNYSVNIIRHINTVGQFTTGFTGISGPGVSISEGPYNAIDGGGDKLQWNDDGPVPDSNATGSLRLTLDTVYKLGGFRSDYLDPGYRPSHYEIRVSTTGFASMTPVVPFGGAPSQIQTDTIAPVDAQFIEYVWKGTVTQPYVLLQEFQAFASTSNPFPIATNGGFDIVAMQNSGANPVTASYLNSSAGWLGDPVANVKDLNTFSYIRGNGSSGIDAQLLLDLGDQYEIGKVSLGFYQGQTWANGIKIETSQNNSTFVTAFDTHSNVGPQNIGIRLQTARYLRFTNYGSSGGALSDIQVFIPEPASATLFGLGGLLLLGRCRRQIVN